MKRAIIIGFSLAPLTGFSQEKSENHTEKTITRIAFGSCNNPQKKAKPIFDSILKEKPDVFVFLGDNIYGDTEDMELLKKKYSILGKVADYQKLQKQCKVLATWDDHDYGVNDGGKSYPKRVESQQVFLDFFKEPTDSVRRKRNGVYGSYTFGEKGKTCQVILLDTRYFRDELKRVNKKRTSKSIGWYEPTNDPTKTLLGKEQWTWLEKQLQVPADVRVIASSIQALSYEKGMESWGNVPHEQRRLFTLLKKYKAHHTVMISGDVHFAELSKKDIGGYPLYDLTSSGITHTSKTWYKAENSFRIGKAYAEKNAGIIGIDWDKKTITLSVINAKNETPISKKIPFADLEFK